MVRPAYKCMALSVCKCMILPAYKCMALSAYECMDLPAYTCIIIGSIYVTITGTLMFQPLTASFMRGTFSTKPYVATLYVTPTE